jgi:hypothetical protein
MGDSMNQTDLFPSGWYDNTQTNHREFYRDGKRTRHGHRSGISPDSPHDGFREPWLTYTDVVHEVAAQPSAWMTC